MECSCGIYFWYGVMAALLPSLLALAVLLAVAKRGDNND